MNYADLFRVMLPETALEVAALIVLVVDLAFLRKAALNVRTGIASLLGIAGCLAGLWLMEGQGVTTFSAGGNAITALLVTGGYAAVAELRTCW